MKNKIIQGKMIPPYEAALWDAEKSAATMEKYLYHVRQFVACYAGKRIDKALILEYKTRLGGEYAVSGANAALAAINGFLRFWGLESCCVKPFKVQKQIYQPEEKELTREEYVRLVKAAKEKQRAPCAAAGNDLRYRNTGERTKIYHSGSPFKR